MKKLRPKSSSRNLDFFSRQPSKRLPNIGSLQPSPQLGLNTWYSFYYTPGSRNETVARGSFFAHEHDTQPAIQKAGFFILAVYRIKTSKSEPLDTGGEYPPGPPKPDVMMDRMA